MDERSRAAVVDAVLADIPHQDGIVWDCDIADDGSAALALVTVNPAGGGGLWMSFCEQWQGAWNVLVLSEASGAGHNYAAGRWVSFACGDNAPHGSQAVRLDVAGLRRERPVDDHRYVVAIWHAPECPEPVDDVIVTFV